MYGGCLSVGMTYARNLGVEISIILPFMFPTQLYSLFHHPITTAYMSTLKAHFCYLDFGSKSIKTSSKPLNLYRKMK